MEHIYLDNAASAPLRPEALKAMVEVFQKTGNASSIHHYGRTLEYLLETAREDIADLTEIRPQDIVFTSGGTEANNTVIHAKPWRKIILSHFEHDSLIQPARALDQGEDRLEFIPTRPSGLIDLECLKHILDRETEFDTNPKDTILVSVLAVSGETGCVQPIGDVSALCAQYGVSFHCDAIQYLGSGLSLKETKADFISLSAHKIGGPQGIGALILKPGLHFKTFHQGGGQERQRRSGTSPTALATGFAEAVKCVHKEIKQEKHKRYSNWRTHIIDQLTSISSDILIYGEYKEEKQTASLEGNSGFSSFINSDQVSNLSSIVSFSVPDWSSQEQVIALDLAGIAVSAGSACSSGKNKIPLAYQAILKAQNKDENRAASSLRISMGWTNSDEDIERFITVWREHYANTLRAQSA